MDGYLEYKKEFYRKKSVSHFFMALIVLISFSVVYCTEKKVSTPEEAFAIFLESYKKSDAKTMAKVLTKESLDSINTMLEPIQDALSQVGGEPHAQAAFSMFADQIGVPVEKLGSITAIDYLGYALKMQNDAKGADTDIIPASIVNNPEVVRKEEKENYARLFFKDGASLPFKKTKSGWQVQILMNTEAPPSPLMPK